MQHLEVSCVVRHFFKSLGFKGLTPLTPPVEKNVNLFNGSSKVINKEI